MRKIQKRSSLHQVKITKLVLPEGQGIRHELGVSSGTLVTPFYDPMIAKLIVKGRTVMKQ